MKKILYLTICIFLLLNGHSYSKSLPPGSAVSLPANILILLDRTNSMLAPASRSSSANSMRAPMGVAQDPNTKHYFIPQILGFGTLLWNGGALDGTSNEKTANAVWANMKKAWCYTHHQSGPGNLRNCSSTTASKKPFEKITGIEVYKDWLYQVVQEGSKARIHQLIPSTSNKIDRHWRGAYTFDGNCNSAASPIICKEVYNKGYEFQKNLKIDIQNGMFYGVAHDHMIIRDLSIPHPDVMDPVKYNGQLNRGTKFTHSAVIVACKYSNGGVSGGTAKWYSQLSSGMQFKQTALYANALAIGSDNHYMYFSQGSNIVVYELNETGACKGWPINLNVPTATFTNPCGASKGLITDPSDASILYSSSYYSDKVCRMELNTGRTGYSSFVKVGISDNNKTSGPGAIYLGKPTQLAFDADDNLLVTNENRLEILVLDKNLDFVRAFGGGGVSRLVGAIDAIKAVVQDSTITSGANIGFGVWSKYEGNPLYTGWDSSKTPPRNNECDIKNCLLARINSSGAADTYNWLNKGLSTHLHTDATAFANLAKEYFSHSDSPLTGLECETNYLIVIGDGGWGSTHTAGRNIVKELHDTGVVSPTTGKNAIIKTVAVAYGDSIKPHQFANFEEMAQVGGTNHAIKALDDQDLKIELHSIITSIINENLSYTAPAISGEIEEGGSLYQAQFDYYSDQEWEGTLKKSTIDSTGNVSATIEWDAAEKLKIKGSTNRKIWSVIPGTNYYPDYNNFVDSNAPIIKTELFENLGLSITDYHNDSLTDKLTNGRCGDHGDNVPSVQNGTMDDAAGLINFIRGQDYFDYKGQCKLTEDRDHMLADIYNSQIVIVGKPEANVNFLSNFQESYWRSLNNYAGGFAIPAVNRTEVIYAGANNGILHAFRADNGEELWGFVPPLIAGKLPLTINQNYNQGGAKGGGSNPIFAVDGSPVVHDVYMKGLNTSGDDFETNNSWRTVLMIPYGRGGAGFSVLDVTIPEKPLHIYSILNDTKEGYVYHVDHKGNFNKYYHGSTTYRTEEFIEIQAAISGSTLYTDSKLTLPGNIDTSSATEQKVYVNGDLVCSSSCFTASGLDTIVNLGGNIIYQGDPNLAVSNPSVQAVVVNEMENAGEDYNYRYLAETWSAPRIFRMPNNGSGDNNIADDTYVAVMGGGYGSVQAGMGSNLLVINLEDGKLLKQIDIDDEAGNGIVNSVPNTPIVITPDSTGVNFAGALVYVNDVEGKITKINLTNMTDNGAGSTIDLYDKTTIMSLNSSSENGRYMFHSLEASIGGDTGNLWLYGGTGNYLNLNDGGIEFPDKVSNLLLGIKDKDFPNFKIADVSGINDLTDCKDTTGTTVADNCPDTADLGWYIKLDPNSPTTSTRTKVTAEPTIFKGVVYYPIYKPANIHSCSLGEASICAVDDECGTNKSSELDPTGATTLPNSCYVVGTGAISKIIIFGDDLYANIAGESSLGGRKDIIVITSATGDANSFRLNWRENF